MQRLDNQIWNVFENNKRKQLKYNWNMNQKGMNILLLAKKHIGRTSTLSLAI